MCNEKTPLEQLVANSLENTGFLGFIKYLGLALTSVGTWFLIRVRGVETRCATDVRSSELIPQRSSSVGMIEFYKASSRRSVVAHNTALCGMPIASRPRLQSSYRALIVSQSRYLLVIATLE